MSEFRITSVADPIASSPDATRSIVASVLLADVMRLLPQWVADEQEVAIDSRFLRDFGETVVRAGIGRGLAVNFESDALLAAQSDELEDAVRSLWQALDESPYPNGEWSGVRARLEDEQLASLLRISPSSLRRYAGGERETPDEIAWRLHTLARIVAALSGSYNDYGVRRWFQRRRAQLGGRTPAEVFSEASGEDDEDLTSVVELAKSLVGPGLAA